MGLEPSKTIFTEADRTELSRLGEELKRRRQELEPLEAAFLSLWARKSKYEYENIQVTVCPPYKGPHGKSTPKKPSQLEAILTASKDPDVMKKILEALGL